MDVTPNSRSRSRSRSRTRNSVNSRAGSFSRRPSLGSRRSISSSSLNRLQVTNIADFDKNIPTVQAYLDNTLPLDFFKQDILGLVKALRVSKWHKKDLDPTFLIVNRISGALTNSIYKIEYKDIFQDIMLPSLLLRVYGKNAGSIIDRDSELHNLVKLSHKSIGPRLLGIFSNGRFEQFLDGFKALTKDELRDVVISQMIARRMKDLHYQIPLDEAVEDDDDDELPMSWRLIYKWMHILQKDFIPTLKERGIAEEDIFFVKFDRFKELIDVYRESLFSKYEEPLSSNYKFCHNDTQYGNLLIHDSFKVSDAIVKIENSEDEAEEVPLPFITTTSNRKDTSLVVIDFEYSGSNFPALDIANHFSEWMADYHDPEKSYYIHDDHFPTQLQQLNYIKSYVEYDFKSPSSTLKTKTKPDSANVEELISYEIKKLYNETILWRATVQIYWCLWGLIQGGMSPQYYTTSSESAIDGTYNITTSMENLQLDEKEVTEETVSSSDDDFDYFKYSQQKASLVIADFISSEFLTVDEVQEELRPSLKFLVHKLYDV